MSIVCFICTTFLAINAYHVSYLPKVKTTIIKFRHQNWELIPKNAQPVLNYTIKDEYPIGYVVNLSGYDGYRPPAHRVGPGSVWGDYYCTSTWYEKTRIEKIIPYGKNFLGLPKKYVYDYFYVLHKPIKEDITLLPISQILFSKEGFLAKSKRVKNLLLLTNYPGPITAYGESYFFTLVNDFTLNENDTHVLYNKESTH